MANANLQMVYTTVILFKFSLGYSVLKLFILLVFSLKGDIFMEHGIILINNCINL